MPGLNRPSADKTQLGVPVTLGGVTPAAAAVARISSRCVSGGSVGGVQHRVPELGCRCGADHCGSDIRDICEGVQLIRAADSPDGLTGQGGGNHAFAGVGNPDSGSEEIGGDDVHGGGSRGGTRREQLLRTPRFPVRPLTQF